MSFRRVVLVVGLAATSTFALPQGVQGEPGCDWGPRLGGSGSVTVGNTDSLASYWTYRFAKVAGTELVLKGTFPDSRFMSLSADLLPRGGRVTGAGPQQDTLYDQEIVPSTGSYNPFSSAPSTAGQARNYTIRVVFTAKPATPAANTLYLGDAVATDPARLPDYELWYRIYNPDDPASPKGGVPLPKVTWQTTTGIPIAPGTRCGVEVPLVGATARSLDGSIDFPVPLPQSSAGDPTFARISGGSGESANSAGEYLTASVDRNDGNFVVIHGKAPTFPNTQAGDEPYDGGEVRYWSFCGSFQRNIWCTADFETAVDASGHYTLVVSDPSQKPTNATAANGVTWRPLGGLDPQETIVYRHILRDPSFDYAIAEVPPGADAATAQSVMDDYYPEARYCDKATFESGGWSACA